ncbi:hypothetical protein ANANG_G00230580 [Anguilla anguilla]|uniref:Nuclear receptor corepressor 1 n=1 Tax=Anguilla anguilla TaxID=7936 RepID=A0A9D3LXE7_ANGAN|nr:hypothetical protein ANANG_G00230580 [Anguilla anguilla]
MEPDKLSVFSGEKRSLLSPGSVLVSSAKQGHWQRAADIPPMASLPFGAGGVPLGTPIIGYGMFQQQIRAAHESVHQGEPERWPPHCPRMSTRSPTVLDGEDPNQAVPNPAHTTHTPLSRHGQRPTNIPSPPPLIPSAKLPDKPSFIQGGSISQGTPGTYLPSHSQAAYGQEAARTAAGSISLGLPRLPDPATGNPTSAAQDGSVTMGTPAKVSSEAPPFRTGSITQGTPALSQPGVAADVLLKGTITKLATEDHCNPERSRGEAFSKGQVIFEGESGHILSYTSMKNPQEDIRSPRGGGELKRTHDMMEGWMTAGPALREAALYEGLVSRAMPKDSSHSDPTDRVPLPGSIMQGTPRGPAEAFEEGHKYSKQTKRESPPACSFEGGISKGKPYEGVNTIREMGRSVHEIPRQDLSERNSRKAPDLPPGARLVLDGSISQGSQLKYEGSSRSQSALKHNVKSLLSGPSKAHGQPQREPERVRHTVVTSTASVLRSTHADSSRPQPSPGVFEDAAARRTLLSYSAGSTREGTPPSGKGAGHERKGTPSQQEAVPTKSPGTGGEPLPPHGPFDPHHRVMMPGEVYRGHLPHLDPAANFHRGMDPAAYLFQRHPSPAGYPSTYQLYAMENTRQTILNDYITSQQMQVVPRSDVATALSPREQQLAVPYPPGSQGIIDLAQMPPAILLAHSGVTGTPPLDRFGYIPGGQAPFPPRPFNPASISPGLPAHFATATVSAERERERERDQEQKEQEREQRERGHERREREREREREQRERERMVANEYLRGGLEPGRPGSRGYLRSPSPSTRPQESGMQQRPSIFQNTNSKSVITPLPQVPSACLSQSGSRRSAPLVDRAVSAPQMDMGKAREGRADASAPRRAPPPGEQQYQRQELPYMPDAASLPGAKSQGEDGRERAPPTKSRMEEELRTRGKTTITAANFIDVIITRKIASDKDSRERGSQSLDSSGSLPSSRYDGGSPALTPAQAQDRQEDRPLPGTGSSRSYHYGQPLDSFPPLKPPSPQPEGRSPAPKTHRVMTLADHISHIIVQDFVRNKEHNSQPSSNGSPAPTTATFQSSAPSSTSSAPAKAGCPAAIAQRLKPSLETIRGLLAECHLRTPPSGPEPGLGSLQIRVEWGWMPTSPSPPCRVTPPWTKKIQPRHSARHKRRTLQNRGWILALLEV